MRSGLPSGSGSRWPSVNSGSNAALMAYPSPASSAMACLRKVREHASHGCPSGRTRSDAIAAAPGAYGSGTNVRGSGMMRTSPTGPMPSTGWRWSSMFIAIIATV